MGFFNLLTVQPRCLTFMKPKFIPIVVLIICSLSQKIGAQPIPPGAAVISYDYGNNTFTGDFPFDRSFMLIVKTPPGKADSAAFLLREGRDNTIQFDTIVWPDRKYRGSFYLPFENEAFANKNLQAGRSYTIKITFYESDGTFALESPSSWKNKIHLSTPSCFHFVNDYFLRQV